MNLRFKKFLSLLLVLTMMLGILPTGIVAAGTEEEPTAVAKVGDTEYATIDEAIAACTNGATLTLLAEVPEDITVPAGVIFNGNGKQVGNITAAGEITFNGYTKASSFSVKNTNTTINITKGACLELTGTSRMVIGHGCTFNITGTINEAKTANVADLTPSLIMPGASFTGAGVTFNVTDAYIKAPSSYCSSSKSASGTFDFNIDNSIWESAGKLAFESQSTSATVNFNLVNSVLTTGSHLVFGVSRGEIVIDNSNVNVGTSRQIENQSTMIIKNGSVVNGAVATSSNAKNPGTVIVENATYAVTGEFSGSDLGTGTIIVKSGATVSAGSITNANIQIDATDMEIGDEVNLTANLSKLAGNITVINNDKLDANIVNGKIVMAKKPAAKIGEQGYETIAEALAAAQAGDIVTILPGEYAPINISNKNITIQGTVGADGELLTTIKGGDPAILGHGFNGTIKDLKIVDAWKVMYAEPAGNVTVDNVYVTGATYGFHLVAYSKDLTWTIQNSYMDLAWANSFGVYGGDAEIVIKGNKFESTNPYYPDYGALHVNSFLPNVTVEENIFGENAKINIDASVTDTSKINISKNYHADGVDKAFVEDSGVKVEIDSYYAAIDANGNPTDLRTVPKGNDFTGYTSADAIWGEVWGNANESFVIKVLDANGNVMGTTSLNNIGGIINGNVNVTWHLLFDAASNKDEYWTMEWTTAPTIDNMPAKVELWVDGVKVSGGNVVLNGPDDLNKIVAAVTDENGVILGYYTNLQSAITDVAEGQTIVLLRDVTVTNPAYGQNALNYTKAVNATIDLNGFTLSADTGNSVFRFNITNSGATSDITVTIKNGTVVAGSNTWCALMAAGISEDIKAVMNLQDLTVKASKAGDLAVKAWEFSVINATNVTVEATNAAGGFYAVGGEIVLNNCTVNQKGLHTAPYLSMAFAVSNGGKLTVNSGNYSSAPTAAEEGDNQGTSHGSWVGGVMNSGGTLIINGGTFTNDNFGDNALATAARGMIIADTGAKVEINGGTFNALKNVLDIQNNLGNADKNPSALINDGEFTADPRVSASYGSNLIKIKADYEIKQNSNGMYYLSAIHYVAQIGEQGYETLADALAAANAGDTITLLAPVVVNAGETLTLDKDVTITYTSNVPGEDMFTNRGTMIVDGATLVYINNDTTGRNVTVSTISSEPGSVLEVKSGVVKNDSDNNSNAGQGSFAYAIDLLTNGGMGDVTATISGGEVISTNYMAIRQFNNGTACKNALTVTGGEIYGAKRAIQVHLKNDAAYLTISDGKIGAGTGGYALCLYPENATHIAVTGGEFSGEVYSGTNDFVSGGTFTNMYDDYCAPGFKLVETEDGKLTIDAVAPVAMIGEDKYYSLQDALDAAIEGQTVKLTANIEVGTADAVTSTNNLTVMFKVEGKSITLDLNGHIINAAYDSTELLYAVVYVADGASLTVNDSTGIGGITLDTGNTTAVVGKDLYDCVAYMFLKNGTNGELTINGGNYTANKVEDSMVYTNGDRVVIINGGSFILTNVGTEANGNGAPWIFNTKGQNEKKIVVNGGTYNFDINHQFWAHEVEVPETKAVVKNEDGTWTVVTAAVYVVETADGYNRYVGYATLSDAINSIAKNAPETTIVLNNLNKPVTVKGQYIGYNYPQKVVIDLNGQTMTSSDRALNVYRSGSSLTIKNGTVHGNTSAGTISVTGGTQLILGENAVITSGGSASAIQVAANGTLIINDASVKVLGGAKKADIVDAGGKIVISAGSFNHPVKQEWCAEFYSPTADKNTEGYYGVYFNPEVLVTDANGEKYPYHTLSAALKHEKTTDGSTIVLNKDIDLNNDTGLYKEELTKLGGQYDTYFKVEGTLLDNGTYASKTITIDLNGYDITGTYSGEDMLVGVFSTDNNGHLILKETLNPEDDTEFSWIDIYAGENSTVYGLVVNYEDGCSIEINGGYFTLDCASDSIVYSGATYQFDDNGKLVQGIHVKAGSFILGNLGKGPEGNGSPWIFNAGGRNQRKIYVTGGTYNADINHQYWAHEVDVPSNIALYEYEAGYWTIAEAVATVIENNHGYNRVVGYASLQEAIDAKSVDGIVTLMPLTNEDGSPFDFGTADISKPVILDLGGMQGVIAKLNVVAGGSLTVINGTLAADSIAADAMNTNGTEDTSDDVYYATFQEAVNAAIHGDVVVLLANCSDDISVVYGMNRIFSFDFSNAVFSGKLNVSFENSAA